jgi:outer membrane receptor protein involved in Fe transport
MPRPHTLAAILLMLLIALPAWGQDRGGITGKVTDKKTGHAIPFATITVVGAQKGGLTDSEGNFLITGVPLGTFEVKVQFLGYAPVSQPGVVITAGKNPPLNFALSEIVVQQEKTVEVSAERRLVEVRQGTTVRSVSAADIRNLPVQTITDVLQQQAGINTDADQIHVRGGRADETVFVVNGVANRDLVTGQSTAGQLNARSVAEVNVATGAYDVRYGNALSGVVEVRLKEGGDRFEGGVTTSGATYGGRAAQLTMGGPLSLSPAGKGPLSWFIDLSTNYQSTRFPSIDKIPGAPKLHSSYQDGILDRNFGYGDFFAPSEDNNWSGRTALTWKPNTSDRWNLDLSKRVAIDQGFSRTFINASGDAGDPSYPWRWKNRIDHAPTIFEDNVQASLKWRRTLSTTGYTEMQFSRYYSALRRDVMGKNWRDYEPPDDISLFPPGDPRRSDYFFDSGDDNTWQDRRTLTYGLTWGLTKRLRRNELEFGFDHQSQTAQYVTIENPWEPDPDGLGGSHDIWRVHPWVGNLYARDRLEFEGFTANIGLRADYWFVGREAEQALSSIADTINITPTTRQEFFDNTRSFFGRRYKLKFSPRIIVAHPITEHSSFFFNYGQFTQNPSYRYVYSKLTSISSESFPLLGNPNLNPQVSINYEVGAKHQFLPGTAANATFFVKDIYDYPTSTLFTRTQGSNLVPILVYLNGHFARSKGFEIELEKRRGSGYWSGKLSYTFQQTRGKSSDPNEAKVAQQNEFDASETRLSETFVRWNRPHKVSANFDLRFIDRAPQGWEWLKQTGLNLYIQGQSGRAYTQVFGPTSTQAAEPFSRNGLFQITTDVKINHYVRFGGQRLDLGLAGLNVFNNRIINRVDAVTGRGRVWGVGQYDPSVFPDVNAFVKTSDVDDPSNYGPPAQWRVSLDYDF